LITLTVKYTCKPGQTEAVLDGLRRMSALVKAHEPGCKAYQISRSEETPALLFLYELYEDQAALDFGEGAAIRRDDRNARNRQTHRERVSALGGLAVDEMQRSLEHLGKRRENPCGGRLETLHGHFISRNGGEYSHRQVRGQRPM